MPLQLGGLASGMDTESVIAQLMAIERRSQIKLKLKQRQVETRQNALRDVATRLRNLKAAAADLRSVALWADTQTVESSDATKLAGRRVASAASGAYQVEISQLARAEQRTYNYTASTSDTSIDVSGVIVSVAANSTIEQAADAINKTSGVKVYASVVSGQLVLSSKTTGTDGAFTATGTTVAEDTAKARVALNASYTVDGVSKTSQTNVTADGIAGIELTFKGLTAAGTPVTITVGNPGPDKEAVKAKVKAFVDQYSSTVGFITEKLKEKPVAEPKNDADYLKGALHGDGMLRGLLSQLRTTLSYPVSGNPSDLDELHEIGLSTGGTTGGAAVSQDSVSGRLALDEAKLTAALDKDPKAVKALLGGVPDVSGLAQRYEALISPATQTGGTIDARLQGADRELTRMRDSLLGMDRRLARKEVVLRAQFEAMEQALARSQQHGAWLARQLG
ncbi:MAG: flagellar filament capping protein FliD [Actinomycetota bacterium]|nr:flagellar filament capping protein FliD [Actinomycetota bacterium]